MTAKQALRERVDTLSEEEAEEWLARMEWESTEFDEITDEQMKGVLEGRAQIAAGDWVDGEEFLREWWTFKISRREDRSTGGGDSSERAPTSP